MNRNQRPIRSLLESLDSWNRYRSTAATEQQLALFVREAGDGSVSETVIEQLAGLYSICAGFSYETVMAFHYCYDVIIFEWWDGAGDLWLRQKDFYTLRWNNRTENFSLGDAFDVSFGNEDESRTLVGLIDICVREIKSE